MDSANTVGSLYQLIKEDGIQNAILNQNTLKVMKNFCQNH